MKKIYLLLFIIFSFFMKVSFAEEIKVDSSKVVVPNIKLLLLIDNKNDLKDINISKLYGLNVVGVEIPGGINQLKKELEPLFMHLSLTKKDILELKEEIILYYKRHNRPFVVVQIPPQNVSKGVLVLIVKESKLEDVKVSSKWQDETRIKNYVRLKPSEPIDENLLLQDVNFINRNPFRRVDIIYSPGSKEYTTNVELAVQDRFPLRVYTGAENTGLQYIGRQRWFAGFSWGNALHWDHVLSYQYTASYDCKGFQGHIVNYTALLPWRNVINLFGGYSSVYADNLEVISQTQDKGTSAQASFRYVIPFFSFKKLSHELLLGFDYKTTNNTLEFVEQRPVFGNKANLTQFVLGYNLNYTLQKLITSFNLDIMVSPMRWLEDQSNQSYSNLRYGADCKYTYGVASLVSLFKLPHDFSFSILFKGQLSSKNLLPSEQLGVGGYNSVRGYYNRTLNGDDGFLVSIETRSPPVNLLHHRMQGRVLDNIQFLAFIDYGLTREHKPEPSDVIDESDYLLSIGPGIRYVIDPYFSLRFDWGIRLHDKKEFPGSRQLIHFSVTAGY